MKRCLLLGRKVMTNLDSILKSRDITLPTKFLPVKAMFFPVVMYGCESWTMKKAEHCRIDASELWCWRRLLRAPWTARRSNQSILKEICTRLLCPWDSSGKRTVEGCRFLHPGDLPDPGTEPVSPSPPVLAGRFLPLSHLGSPRLL